MIPHHRHTIRLYKHNYSSPQIYFITIGAYHHYQIFGEIKNKIFSSSKVGDIIENTLNSMPNKFHCQIIISQIMPNHMHFILKMLKPISKVPITLGQIIRYFKAKSAFEIRKQNIYPAQIFQRNYYEHIVRDENDLTIRKKYISSNPKNWFNDSENHPPFREHL